MRAAISLPTTGTIPEPCSTISVTRTSSTLSDTPSFRRTGSATSGEIRLAAHLKRAWMCVRQMRPPVGAARARCRLQAAWRVGYREGPQATACGLHEDLRAFGSEGDATRAHERHQVDVG